MPGEPNPIDPRAPVAANQRTTWLAWHMPAHPWRFHPEGRQALAGQTGLREAEIDLLLAEFAAREKERTSASNRGSGWRAWLNTVLGVRVDVRPGGRAILRRPPGVPPTPTVEFRFTPTGRRVAREPEVTLQEIRISSDFRPPHIVPEVLDLSIYFAAFRLRLGRTTRPRRKGFYDVVVEPAPGKPAAMDYYRLLLAEFEELKANGHPSPAKEIAERRGIKRPTLRWQLSRARELEEARRGRQER